jgi:hypothetical protein
MEHYRHNAITLMVPTYVFTNSLQNASACKKICFGCRQYLIHMQIY